MGTRAGGLLEDLAREPGIVATAVLDPDGRTIERASSLEGASASIGPAPSRMLRDWMAVGDDLRLGNVRSVTIDRRQGGVAIMPLAEAAALVVLADASCRLGRLRAVARHARDRSDQLVLDTERRDDQHRPAVVPPHRAPPAAVARPGKDGENPVAESPRSREGACGGAEIVLTGAHTFRLVTKLVGQLLKIDGIRSSRLRAYSPSSTIVDVVLDGGVTLETIDMGSLKDLCVERTETRGSRMVLRAGLAARRAGFAGAG